MIKLETIQLSYYLNTARMSQQNLHYNNQQVKLYHRQQFLQMKLVSMLQLEDSG